jgi:hypothetical protein
MAGDLSKGYFLHIAVVGADGHEPHIFGRPQRHLSS